MNSKNHGQYPWFFVIIKAMSRHPAVLNARVPAYWEDKPVRCGQSFHLQEEVRGCFQKIFYGAARLRPIRQRELIWSE